VGGTHPKKSQHANCRREELVGGTHRRKKKNKKLFCRATNCRREELVGGTHPGGKKVIVSQLTVCLNSALRKTYDGVGYNLMKGIK
jgi:hypothetical protein